MTSVIRILIWGVLAASLMDPVLAQDGSFERERAHMVATQIEVHDMQDPATLESMRRVPRHLFVPEDRRRHAYQDRPVPIGYGQTISQPSLVAYMTELLRPWAGMRVLEIGTGSGYQAAVLAAIVDEVFTIEIIGELTQWGDANLRRPATNTFG